MDRVLTEREYQELKEAILRRKDKDYANIVNMALLIEYVELLRRAIDIE